MSKPHSSNNKKKTGKKHPQPGKNVKRINHPQPKSTGEKLYASLQEKSSVEEEVKLAEQKQQRARREREVQRNRRVLIGAAAGLLVFVILIIIIVKSSGKESTPDKGTSETGITAEATEQISSEAVPTEAVTEVKTEDDSIHKGHTIDKYLGCKDVLGWLNDHFTDYYFKTPYAGLGQHLEHPEELMRPYGEYGEDAEMNCTGFVSHVVMSTGGDLDKIAAMGMKGSFGDADSYLYLALKDLVVYQTFDSVEELLASGKARKGDILYLYPKKDSGNEDCHIGFFWGDTSSENKFWSQSRDTLCTVTEIEMLDPIGKIYWFPVSGDLE